MIIRQTTKELLAASLQELGQQFVNEWLLHDDKLPSDELIQLLEKAMPEELRPYLCCKV